MSSHDTNIVWQTCAACGKGGDGLKSCTACKVLRYCSVACQKKHWPSHKRGCKKAAADYQNQNMTHLDKPISPEQQQMLSSASDDDDALFQDPPPKEDCPICLLPIPICSNEMGIDTSYTPCCGKIQCGACIMASAIEMGKGNLQRACVFCREPVAKGDAEYIKRVKKRMDLNDPEAFYVMGQTYEKGISGMRRDDYKAFKLFCRGAELGSSKSHFAVADAYVNCIGTEKDTEKSRYHDKMAAIGGHEIARQNFGNFEKNLASMTNMGDMRRAMKHFMIAAKAGLTISLKEVGIGYKNGHVTREEYETTLRAYKEAQDEMMSDERTKAYASPIKLRL